MKEKHKYGCEQGQCCKCKKLMQCEKNTAKSYKGFMRWHKENQNLFQDIIRRRDGDE